MPPPSELVIGWDLETCPLPDAHLPGAFAARLGHAVAAERRRRPDLTDEEADRRARSLHPMLGWVCCASAARLGPDGSVLPAKSYTARTPDEEADLLRALWSDLARLPAPSARRVRFVTFNGKRFDCDWLRVRSARHAIAPARHDVLCTHRYRTRPHADLAHAFGCACSLDDVCALLGVARGDAGGPPDGGAPVTGSTVAGAVAEGRLEAVAHYCSADVAATLACYAPLRPLLGSR